MLQPDARHLAFVAGSTGYTGRFVSEVLAEKGVKVVAHIRPDSRGREKWTGYFESAGASVDSTPWQPDAMKDALRQLQPTLVFSLLGTTRAKARVAAGGADSYASVDYALSVMLLDAAVAAGSRPCFTFLSSLGASSASRNEYLRIRGAVEDKVRASGLAHIIVRPAVITGPDRDESRPLERISASLSDPLLGFAAILGAKSTWARYASMQGRELAEGIVRFAMGHPRDSDAGRIVTYEDIRARVS